MADRRDAAARRLVALAKAGDTSAKRELLNLIASEQRSRADDVRILPARQASGQKADPVLVDIANMGPDSVGLPEAIYVWAGEHLATEARPPHRPPDPPGKKRAVNEVVAHYLALRAGGRTTKDAVQEAKAAFPGGIALPSDGTIMRYGRTQKRK